MASLSPRLRSLSSSRTASSGTGRPYVRTCVCDTAWGTTVSSGGSRPTFCLWPVGALCDKSPTASTTKVWHGRLLSVCRLATACLDGVVIRDVTRRRSFTKARCKPRRVSVGVGPLTADGRPSRSQNTVRILKGPCGIFCRPSLVAGLEGGKTRTASCYASIFEDTIATRPTCARYSTSPFVTFS